MNVLFCGDSGITKGIYLSVMSLLKNASRPINVYILTASIGKRQAIDNSFAERLRTAADKKGAACNIYLIDITERFCDYLPLANMTTRFTPLCMLRLFADETPEIPDKILYLDTDVLCRKNFDELYDFDISDIEIAGVPDRYGKWFFSNPLLHNYLNSGVLLLNMANIRKSGLFFKCRKMCRDKKMFMPDQTALNKLAVKTKLPRRFNEQGKIREDTVFKHFTTFFKFFPYIRAVTIKPWDVEKLHGELKIFEFDYLLNEYKKEKDYEQRNTGIFYH